VAEDDDLRYSNEEFVGRDGGAGTAETVKDAVDVN
jgi:hypothetical protein